MEEIILLLEQRRQADEYCRQKASDQEKMTIFFKKRLKVDGQNLLTDEERIMNNHMEMFTNSQSNTEKNSFN